MSYQLDPAQDLRHGARRIALEQIDSAVARLQRTDDPAAAVHATRKNLKKIRALLRLIRPALAPQTFRTENARFRDIGQMLSGARDGQVVRDTLSALHATAKGRTASAFAAAVDGVAATAGREMPVDTATLEAAREALLAARIAMAKLDVEPDLAKAFDGMVRTLREAGKAFRHGFATLDDEDLHDLRKRVQHHWRHMALLSAAWPEMLDARAATARQLSQVLGEDHDIAVLLRLLDDPLDGETTADAGAPNDSAGNIATSSAIRPIADALAVALTAAQRRLIHAHGRKRQMALRRLAYTLSQRLLAEDAENLRDTIAYCWRTAGPEPEIALAAE